MPIQSINIPTSGLRAAQRNLAVTGHNMANVSTDGFSRQRVNQATFGYHNIGMAGSNTMQVGMGTDIVGIQQLRNQFLDIEFRSEIGRANFYDRMHRASVDIEVTMAELSNPSSGVEVTRRIWASLQELSLNPSGMETRGNFISSVTSYINRMNDTHRRLLEQKNVLNGDVKSQINDANRLIRTIDDLNNRIARAEATGQAANDFRDSRNLAMDQLAAILDVDFRTNPRSGHIQVTSNGHQLLSNGHINHIGMRFTEPGSNFVEPVIGPAAGDRILPFDPTFRNASSLLRLDSPPRDVDRPGSLMGTVMARGLMSANHASGSMSFPRYNQEEYPMGSGNFRLVPDTSGMFLADGTELTPDEMSRAQNQWEARNRFNAEHAIIPRTIRHLDIKFNHTVSMINEFLTNQNASQDPSTWGGWRTGLSPGDATVGTGSSPGPGIPIFVVNDPNRINNGHASGNLNNNTMQYTLGNVILNPILNEPEGYNSIGLSTNSMDRDDPTIITNLLSAWQADILSLDGSAPMNINDFYNQIVLILSTETSRLENMSNTQSTIATGLDGLRNSSFGVSLDEEMTNMIQFQHSFNAASRVVNVINDMIETLLML